MNETSQLPIGSGQPQSQSSNSASNTELLSDLKPNGNMRGTMTDEEKYGLPGLLDAIKNENNENFNLAIGHDLTTLGLDLNSSESVFLHSSSPIITKLMEYENLDPYGPTSAVLSQPAKRAQ